MKRKKLTIRLQTGEPIIIELSAVCTLQSVFEKGFLQDVRHILWEICPDEGAVAGYGNRIRVKYTAKWGVQLAGMIFQTRSSSIWYASYSLTAAGSSIPASISAAPGYTFPVVFSR